MRLRAGDRGTVSRIAVLGGGLAGSEAVWQISRRCGPDVSIDLYEMRPGVSSPAHQSGDLAELVCSNSLKSELPTSLTGLLKQNLLSLDSLLIRVADDNRVPAGRALAVDRKKFARAVTEAISALPNVTIIRNELQKIPDGYDQIIVATGPLTSDVLAAELARTIGTDSLHFHDAIAPIIEADSIDMDIAFRQDRYGEAGQGDYINLPMQQAQYFAFVDALLEADTVPLHDFESAPFFDACLPVEEIARRGRQSLAFGPLKPIGLTDHRSGEKFYGVAQLRNENVAGDALNMVGFQTRLTYPEQERVFRLLPGMADAVFLRHGSIHRNTYINSPEVCNRDLSLKAAPHIRLAGQITGVEGYVESIATGLLAGLFVAADLCNDTAASHKMPPPTTTLGALLNYVTAERELPFAPTNINFALFPPLREKVKRRKERRLATLDRAAADFDNWVPPTTPNCATKRLSF